MSKSGYHGPLEQIAECVWRIPQSYKIGMRTEGRIFADDKLIEQIRNDQAPEQVANVACLPGIQMASLAMPDIHWGYGFCIGGVCATDPLEGGVISPGGVGYDINCGVRLMTTSLALSAECVWRIPQSYKIGMRTEGRIFADEKLIEQIRNDQAPEQVANVAFLPGIQMASLAMPDIHWGYGFCIGGVCATDPLEGGVDLAGRSGLRHQLRRAADDHEPLAQRRAAADQRPDGRPLPRDPRRRRQGRAVSLRRQGTAAADGRRRQVSRRPRTGHRRATSSIPRPKAASAGPRPTTSAPAPWSAAPTSAARSAPATISSKCRSSRKSATKRPPGRWAWPRTRSA